MFSKRTVAVLAFSLASAMAFSGCSAQGTDSKAEGGKLSVVTTTGYLGDAIKNIAPEANVNVLVKPGGDPHTQALTTKDIEAVDKADLVVWTSHDMEHKMMSHLDKLGKKQLAAAEGEDIKPLLLPWEEDGKIQGNDPHVWNSPDIWMKVVNHIAKKLGEIDAANAKTYQQNADNYNEKIKAAKDKAAVEFNKIPKENRVLITGHDAFNYLGKTFDMEIHATDFVSSESEMSATQLNELADLIAKKKVPMIFQDNLKNPKAIENLQKAVAAKGWEVKVSDQELFADTLGTEAPLDTYLGAFQHNAETIAKALSPKK